MKQFKEKHNEDLSSVKRVVGQMVQKTEANIAWMDKYHDEISKWLDMNI